MSTATLAGKRIISASLTLPAHGVWWCECALDDEESLSGRVELKIADLTLSGTIVSGGAYKGRSHYRVAGGAARWGSEIDAAAYANDAGVKYSTILTDAARAAGETIAGLPTGTVGTTYARERGPASNVLNQLFPEGWYVDETGTTRIGARTTVEAPQGVQVASVDLARGVVQLGSDSIATLLPGVQVAGITATDVLHEIGDGLRTTIWGAGTVSRRLAALRRLVLQLLPDYRFRGGPYEYRVVTQESERLNLQPIRTSLGLPDLRRVRVRPGLPGCRADLALGSRVLVAFVNADAARAEVVGFEDAEGSGFAPNRLDLGGEDDFVSIPAAATGRVVRYGDPITFSTPGPGVIALPAVGSLSRVRA